MSSPHLLDATNILVLPATIFGNFRYADWRGASDRHGTVGVAWEAMQAVLGTNAEPFFIPQRSDWKIGAVKELLARYGITAVWGVGYWNNELFFRVKGRQADWAQYVLLRAGVPLLHGYIAGSRAGYPIRPPITRRKHEH